jgi:hypothetical protein
VGKSPQQTAGLNLFEDFLDLFKMDKSNQQGGMGLRWINQKVKEAWGTKYGFYLLNKEVMEPNIKQIKPLDKRCKFPTI